MVLFVSTLIVTMQQQVCEEVEVSMPKMKTNRGAAKRFKRTGTGKFLRAKAYKSHILTKKGAKRKRNLRQTTTADATNMRGLRRMLPYL